MFVNGQTNLLHVHVLGKKKYVCLLSCAEKKLGSVGNNLKKKILIRFSNRRLHLLPTCSNAM